LINLATAMLVFVLARRMFGNARRGGRRNVCLLSIVPETLAWPPRNPLCHVAALAGVVLLQNLDDRTSAARIFTPGC